MIDLLFCTAFDRPDVNFNLRMMRALQMIEVPLLKRWIHTNILDGLTNGTNFLCIFCCLWFFTFAIVIELIDEFSSINVIFYNCLY